MKVNPEVSAYMRIIGSQGGKARAKLPRKQLSEMGRKAGLASAKARKRNGG